MNKKPSLNRDELEGNIIKFVVSDVFFKDKRNKLKKVVASAKEMVDLNVVPQIIKENNPNLFSKSELTYSEKKEKASLILNSMFREDNG